MQSNVFIALMYTQVRCTIYIRHMCTCCCTGVRLESNAAMFALKLNAANGDEVENRISFYLISTHVLHPLNHSIPGSQNILG